MLGGRLMGEPFLASLLEELCWRQIEKEHLILEGARGDNCIDAQGIIRGTRYFIDLRANEIQKREGLDRIADES